MLNLEWKCNSIVTTALHIPAYYPKEQQAGTQNISNQENHGITPAQNKTQYYLITSLKITLSEIIIKSYAAIPNMKLSAKISSV